MCVFRAKQKNLIFTSFHKQKPLQYHNLSLFFGLSIRKAIQYRLTSYFVFKSFCADAEKQKRRKE